MAATFGSGAMFSLVSGVGGPNQAANVVTSGLFREEACHIGLLFGGFTGSYHALRCLLRKLRNKEMPWNAGAPPSYEEAVGESPSPFREWCQDPTSLAETQGSSFTYAYGSIYKARDSMAMDQFTKQGI